MHVTELPIVCKQTVRGGTHGVVAVSEGGAWRTAAAGKLALSRYCALAHDGVRAGDVRCNRTDARTIRLRCRKDSQQIDDSEVATPVSARG